MSMDPFITYKESCEILKSKYSRFAAAADRGVFTRLATTGPGQKVIRKQVELFVGKKQLKLSELNREERRIWEELDETYRGANLDEREVPQGRPFPSVEDWIDKLRPSRKDTPAPSGCF